MCEEVSAVKALNFLQNDVSKTVDHDNPEETSIFRSLLSHLLIPSKPPTPPKKRSRQNTPEEAWTNKLDGDEAVTERFSFDRSLHSNRRIVNMEEDPEERGFREGSSLSAERFQQRTELFESLMKFVGEDAKQPSANLLDMINGVGDEV